MIKIEKLLDSGKAVFVREGKTIPVFVGQLLSYHEADTLQVSQGAIVYSIDEAELVTLKAGETLEGTLPETDTKSPESTKSVAPTTETTEKKEVEVAPVTAPIIVKPVPRKK
jgi:hypothetical protein